MDLQLLRTFQKQVLVQCEFMRFAAYDLNESLKIRNAKRTFYSLQNFLNATANVSKALWGQRGSRLEERKALRESIGVTDDSPLRLVALRNHFEHFDERLETWWRDSTTHNYIDFNLLPKTAIYNPDLTDIDWFRNFDPSTTDVYFWGEEFNVQQLINEVQRILPKLTEEANKHDWLTPKPTPSEAPTDELPDRTTTDKPLSARTVKRGS
jgi:hypothetical protein